MKSLNKIFLAFIFLSSFRCYANLCDPNVDIVGQCRTWALGTSVELANKNDVTTLAALKMFVDHFGEPNALKNAEFFVSSATSAGGIGGYDSALKTGTAALKLAAALAPGGGSTAAGLVIDNIQPFSEVVVGLADQFYHYSGASQLMRDSSLFPSSSNLNYSLLGPSINVREEMQTIFEKAGNDPNVWKGINEIMSKQGYAERIGDTSLTPAVEGMVSKTGVSEDVHKLMGTTEAPRGQSSTNVDAKLTRSLKKGLEAFQLKQDEILHAELKAIQNQQEIDVENRKERNFQFSLSELRGGAQILSYVASRFGPEWGSRVAVLTTTSLNILQSVHNYNLKDDAAGKIGEIALSANILGAALTVASMLQSHQPDPVLQQLHYIIEMLLAISKQLESIDKKLNAIYSNLHEELNVVSTELKQNSILNEHIFADIQRLAQRVSYLEDEIDSQMQEQELSRFRNVKKICEDYNELFPDQKRLFENRKDLFTQCLVPLQTFIEDSTASKIWAKPPTLPIENDPLEIITRLVNLNRKISNQISQDNYDLSLLAYLAMKNGLSTGIPTPVPNPRLLAEAGLISTHIMLVYFKDFPETTKYSDQTAAYINRLSQFFGRTLNNDQFLENWENAFFKHLDEFAMKKRQLLKDVEQVASLRRAEFLSRPIPVLSESQSAPVNLNWITVPTNPEYSPLPAEPFMAEILGLGTPSADIKIEVRNTREGAWFPKWPSRPDPRQPYSDAWQTVSKNFAPCYSYDSRHPGCGSFMTRYTLNFSFNGTNKEIVLSVAIEPPIKIPMTTEEIYNRTRLTQIWNGEFEGEGNAIGKLMTRDLYDSVHRAEHAPEHPDLILNWVPEWYFSRKEMLSNIKSALNAIVQEHLSKWDRNESVLKRPSNEVLMANFLPKKSLEAVDNDEQKLRNVQAILFADYLLFKTFLTLAQSYGADTRPCQSAVDDFNPEEVVPKLMTIDPESPTAALQQLKQKLRQSLFLPDANIDPENLVPKRGSARCNIHVELSPMIKVLRDNFLEPLQTLQKTYQSGR